MGAAHPAKHLKTSAWQRSGTFWSWAWRCGAWCRRVRDYCKWNPFQIGHLELDLHFCLSLLAVPCPHVYILLALCASSSALCIVYSMAIGSIMSCLQSAHHIRQFSRNIINSQNYMLLYECHALRKAWISIYLVEMRGRLLVSKIQVYLNCFCIIIASITNQQVQHFNTYARLHAI